METNWQIICVLLYLKQGLHWQIRQNLSQPKLMTGPCPYWGGFQYEIIWWTVNSLPNDKISHQSEFKAFADNKINMTKKLKSV